MMDFEESGFAATRRAIEAHFDAGWTRTPKAFENVGFAPPQGAWVRLLVAHGDSRVAGFGRTLLVRHAGRILVECFVPAGHGAQAAAALADRAAALFAAPAIPGLSCAPPTIRTDGTTGQHFQMTLTIPFRRDTTRSG